MKIRSTHWSNLFPIALFAFALAMPMVGCSNDGPLEDAAEEVEDAVEDVADEVEDAVDG
ncbi:MAG: hypothetical protein K8J08_17520 [Thermoanaerobaculia bacterium]|nr:hypothetical protein [Thermoanaerobaculia bacterium]